MGLPAWRCLLCLLQVALGVACGVLGALLYRSYRVNASLAARVAQREDDLVKLVSERGT